MLSGKNILLISPQRWGKMHLIKHHYAIELAKRGNNVYFLNPPSAGLEKRIQIVEDKAHSGLYIVDYKPLFPFVIRFHFRWIFDLLMGFQITYILRSIGKQFDIVWCYDLLLYTDLKKFKGKFTVFHVADMLFSDFQVKMAGKADVIVSVAEDILTILKDVKVPKYFINHGLSDHFLRHSISALKRLKEDSIPSMNNPLEIGYVGNILRPDIDQECFKNIIENNKGVQFYIWGSTKLSDANLGVGKYLNSNQIDLINFLEGQDNVELCGVREPELLSKEMQKMDAFLICYDIDRDHSKGTNYHKIIEYLSTGKVTVSNNVTTYASDTDLVQMPVERHNEHLNKLFKEVVDNIDVYNNSQLQRKRIEYAIDNTYSKQIDKIENIIEELQ